MVRVVRRVEIAAPRREVFEFLADHGNVISFMHNIKRFQPIGETSHGLGARFRWEATVHGLRVGSEFVVTEFVPHEWMAAVATSGPRSTSTWRLTDTTSGTLAAFATTLELPTGLLPRFVGDRLVEHEIASNMERSLGTLKALLEFSRRPETPVGAGKRRWARRSSIQTNASNQVQYVD